MTYKHPWEVNELTQTKLKEHPIKFFVPGLPKPAGSKKAFLHAKTKKVMVVDACDKSRDWKTTVSQYALAAKGTRMLIRDRPIKLTLSFEMKRPREHFRSNGTVKASAPYYHLCAPDATKLTRAVEDALTDVLWDDDSRVVVQVIEKVYAEAPGVYVTVETLE